MRYLRSFFILAILIISLGGFAQSVISPSAVSYTQNTANQNASGFSIINFNTSTTLLVTVGLVNPPSGTTLRFTTTSGVTASTGYVLTSNFTRISFTGTQANINNVLSSLKVNTGSVPGNVYIAVTATENPTGFFYLPSNGHFYRPISTGAFYTNAKAAAASTTFKGQQGYLVTITNADEDAFIFNNVPQNQIWFALSDVAQEGFWRIDAGPEAGTLIKTSNGQLTGNIAGQYNNWAGGEPNNSGGEHYAVTKWNGSQWNDLPNNFTCPYVIEYGTWTDPANQTFTDFYTGFVTNQIACSPATSPNAPTITNGSRMNAGTVSLSAVPPSGSTVDWYANATGGNVLPNGIGTNSYTTPSISSTTTYYVQSRNTSTGCISSSRTAVTATVNYPTPFTYSGTFYNPINIGLPNINIDLYYKLKSSSSYSLLQTYTTNSLGIFTITTSLDVSLYDFQIIVNSLSISNPTISDAVLFNNKIFNQSFDSKDYYRMNTNGNLALSISDVYLIYRKINGTNYPLGVPDYRIFSQSEWNIINSSSTNLMQSYPGSQTITLTNPIVGGSSVFYVIKTGHSN
jgi:Ig-like domain CHU_C associated